MAKAELGTKRVDPETGKKFYDLNKDPIVSPFTGQSYPRSFFETGPAKARPAPAKAVEEDEVEDELPEGAEFISLEEADDDTAGGVVTTEVDDEDVEIVDDEADVFIEEEEEEGDDVADIIGGVEDEEP
ncbi:TIGR02300 family protein [Kaistia dalseonensis]|uniref:Uncharacterized protein (TIGR02300 family) n=1 Tax=Kaistia dalseonensis TaxID=410840 RepID=A0ABU0H5D6_9HYPH|nr:TIGR02300 family protein [Kaistia dalseonensis]MCX5494946.1 TIGR02300 family protein [Kaistia dalseonensis]MDQ0437527.1 uncharacterized protein (TIGR02300 family) [Kaistia dalseonensis]